MLLFIYIYCNSAGGHYFTLGVSISSLSFVICLMIVVY